MTKAKRASGVAQVVERLPNKCVALTSKHSIAKKKIACTYVSITTRSKAERRGFYYAYMTLAGIALRG
jgi:hypothetical protein